jgi:hypothetical protein
MYKNARSTSMQGLLLPKPTIVKAHAKDEKNSWMQRQRQTNKLN